ncbi:MAG: hypothetical protein WCO84_09755, partial [bacterium]
TKELKWHDSKGLKFGDLPGYGTTNFPKETYFNKFDILQFDLFLCVTNGKFHQADTEFFQYLKKAGKVCIYVVNWHDSFWQKDVSIEELDQLKRDDIAKQVGHNEVDVIFTSCKDGTGLDELNETIRNNLDGAKRERWERGAKAYSLQFLKEKKTACEKYVALTAWLAAANGINPIPGVDVAVDISLIVKLFKDIRDDYGLSESSLTKLKDSTIPLVAQSVNYVVRYATSGGVAIIIKNYATGEITKSIAKYIPFVGQAIAATIGYLIVANAGTAYLDKCHQIAEEILKNNL